MKSRYYALLAAVVALAVVRVVLTYPVFCETFDEPVHIGAGMEWLDRGTYVTDLEHPPLARVLAALGPFVTGVRATITPNFVVNGNAVIYAKGRYSRNMALARAGILPFFIVAILIVAAWARRVGGDAAGLAAALLFSNEPNVLAHAGLATTDMAAAAAVVAVAFFYWRGTRDILFGLILGLALLTKFSTLLFIPVVVAIVGFDRWRRGARWYLVSAIVALLVVWGGYRFSFGSMSTLGDEHAVSHRGPAFALPAPEFFGGIMTVQDHAQRGHGSYLFGEFREHGWWYYFPVAIGLKTTVGFLALLALAIAAAFRKVEDRQSCLSIVAAGLAIVLVSLPVSINIGVRHVLPAYPFFAIGAGCAIALLIERRRKWVAAGLLALCLVPSLAAHPDYLPYFNALARRPPDEIFIDSNLDWGQDLLRLKREIDRRKIGAISLAYAGNAEPDHHGILRAPHVDPAVYTPGWVAISEVMIHNPNGEYRWLDLFKPVARVGKTIRLYYIPAIEELTGGRSLQTALPDRDPGMTGILIPILLPAGEGWRSELAISNSSNRPIGLRARPDSNAPAIVTIEPSQSVPNAILAIDHATNGVVVYAAREDAYQLHFNLKLRSPQGETIGIPVLRQDRAAATPLRFLAVPAGPGSQVRLRVFDLTGHATTTSVKVTTASRSRDRGLTLTRRDASDEWLTLANESLTMLFPDLAEDRVDVTVDAPSSSSWAFITVTDANGTTVLLPD